MNIANNFLITGSSGLLGSELAKYLASTGKKVAGIYRSSSNLVEPGMESFSCDISDPGLVDELAARLGSVDCIVHCAAMVNIDKCEKDKKLCFGTNVVGTRNVVSLARRLEAALVYISTSTVFSGITGNYKEDDTPDPRNFYSLSKLLGEEAVLAYHRGVVIRTVPIGIHSLGRPPLSFFEWLLDSIKNNKDFDLFVDSNINPLSTVTLSRLIPEALNIGHGILHLGSRDHLSKAEIGKLVLKNFPDFSGRVRYISMDEKKDFTYRAKEIWLNADKAIALGMVIPSLESELKLLVDKSKI